MSIKEKLMNKMMDNQFNGMTSEEKQKMMEMMMDKFFSGMTDAEKKDMMAGMMPKMMGQMSGGESNPMMGMMSMMMGEKHEKGHGKMPWDNCMEMMTGFKETASAAKFATPELRNLFGEWCEQIENELLKFIKESGAINTDVICDKFSLSEESVKYLLSRLAKKGLIDYKI